MDAALLNVMQAGSAQALIVMRAQDLRDFADNLIDRTRRVVEAQYNVRYYDVEELATLLHVTKTTIYNFVKVGKLNAEKVGRKTVFNRLEVQEAIKNGTLGRYIHK